MENRAVLSASLSLCPAGESAAEGNPPALDVAGEEAGLAENAGGQAPPDAARSWLY